MYVIFLRADAVAAGQPVDGVQNAEEAVGLYRIEGINGAAGVKGASHAILRGNKSLVQGKTARQEEPEFILIVDFQGIVGFDFPGFKKVTEGMVAGGRLCEQATTEGH
jgi:hypothetical protein